MIGALAHPYLHKLAVALLNNEKIMSNTLYPCLWFDGQAKAAAEFYCSIFKNSRVIDDTPMVVTFELNGARFMGLNAGPQFKFNEAISFVINCSSQQEIDYYWDKLTAGGEESMCGWLKDKFGVSWQVVPEILGDMLKDPDRNKVDNVTKAFLRMKKFDIGKLQRAFNGEPVMAT